MKINNCNITAINNNCDLSQLFEKLNNSINYCVLRNSEDISSRFNPNIHGDIDILVEDLNVAVKVMDAVKVHPESYRVFYKVQLDDSEVSFDIRYVGDGYYDTKWEKEMLDSAIIAEQDGIRFKKVTNIHQYYNLLYHVYLQKKYIAEDYPIKLRKYAQQANELYRDNREFLVCQLEEYMKRNKYNYVLPEDIAVGINWENLKLLKSYNIIRVEFLWAEITQSKRLNRRKQLIKNKLKNKLKLVLNHIIC